MKKLEKIYTKNPEVITKKIGKEVFLIPLFLSKAYPRYTFALNSTSAFMWQCFDGEKNIKKIIEVVSKKYKVSQDKSREYLIDFLDYFTKNKLLLIK